MIEKDDVRAAVGAGILTEAQAASLTALAHSRRGAREQLEPGDEPFELFKGFNEIFIVVGLSILALGWIGIVTLGLIEFSSRVQTYLVTTSLIGGVVLWGLSEYFVRRRRMIAPAIALTVLFAANAAYGFISGMAQVFMLAQQNYSSLPLPIALATFTLLIFWYRFRVPFALAIIALSAFLVSVLIAANGAGAPANAKDLFLLSADGPFALITLVLGILVFAIAMAFDMSDPHRVTRRAANGFWLHVIAAPALVNTVALSLLAQDSPGSNALLFGLLALFAVDCDCDRPSIISYRGDQLHRDPKPYRFRRARGRSDSFWTGRFPGFAWGALGTDPRSFDGNTAEFISPKPLATNKLEHRNSQCRAASGRNCGGDARFEGDVQKCAAVHVISPFTSVALTDGYVWRLLKTGRSLPRDKHRSFRVLGCRFCW